MTSEVKFICEDVLLLASNMDEMTPESKSNQDKVHQELDGLAVQMKANLKSFQSQTISLQDNLTEQIRSFMTEIKGEINEIGRGTNTNDGQNQPVSFQSPIRPKNAKYASSTQFPNSVAKGRDGGDRSQKQDTDPPVNTTTQQSDVSVMATMVQDLMEASNERFGKLVETLCANKPSPNAEGTGMKAKPHKYGGEATDSAVDAWVSLIRMYLEDHKGNENAKVLTLLMFLHRHAQAWIMQKTPVERDTCEKVFALLLKRFGIGASPSDARLRFDERKQQPNEKLDTFLDELEALRITAAPEEPLKTRNLEIMRKFMTGLHHPELHQSLLTSYTGEYYTANPPTLEEIRSKCYVYLTLRRINGNHRVPQNSAASTNQSTPNAWVNSPSRSTGQKPASNQANTNQVQAPGQSRSIDFNQPQNKPR